MVSKLRDAFCRVRVTGNNGASGVTLPCLCILGKIVRVWDQSVLKKFSVIVNNLVTVHAFYVNPFAFLNVSGLSLSKVL